MDVYEEVEKFQSHFSYRSGDGDEYQNVDPPDLKRSIRFNFSPSLHTD